MSGDEVFATVASLILGPLAWAWWLFRAASIDNLRPHRPPVALFGAAVGIAGALIFAVLRFAAAADVRDAPEYLFMYFVMGLAWLRGAAFLFPLAGLNPRDDLIERRNAAAMPAWMGALIGVAACFAGGNVGNGPGWPVVVFSAALATSALGAVWLAVGQWSGLVDLVTVDRDKAAGVRLGGMLAACGLIFGAAVTGDWVSASATVVDFVRHGWAGLVIAVIAIFVERGLRPSPSRPQLPVIQAGVLPALVWLVLATVVVVERLGIVL